MRHLFTSRSRFWTSPKYRHMYNNIDHKAMPWNWGKHNWQWEMSTCWFWNLVKLFDPTQPQCQPDSHQLYTLSCGLHFYKPYTAFNRQKKPLLAIELFCSLCPTILVLSVNEWFEISSGKIDDWHNQVERRSHQQTDFHTFWQFVSDGQVQMLRCKLGRPGTSVAIIHSVVCHSWAAWKV